MSAAGLQQAVTKMKAAGVGQAAINVFADYYSQLEAGVSGYIREEDIEPLIAPAQLSDVEVNPAAARDALGATVVIKLNGGLGTSMGMDKAKSLLPVRDGQSFLDLIVRQVRAARVVYGAKLPLIFMNSFRTHDDTLAALSRYVDLEVDGAAALVVMGGPDGALAKRSITSALQAARWELDVACAWWYPGQRERSSNDAALGACDVRRARRGPGGRELAARLGEPCRWCAGGEVDFAAGVAVDAGREAGCGHRLVHGSASVVPAVRSAARADEGRHRA